MIGQKRAIPWQFVNLINDRSGEFDLDAIRDLTVRLRNRRVGSSGGTLPVSLPFSVFCRNIRSYFTSFERRGGEKRGGGGGESSVRAVRLDGSRAVECKVFSCRLWKTSWIQRSFFFLTAFDVSTSSASSL